LSRDTYDGTLDSPASQNHYAYTHSNPVNYTDPSGHMLYSLIMGASFGNNFGAMRIKWNSSRAMGAIKTLTCGYGVSATKYQYRLDASFKGHGHHAIPKNMGGDPGQDLIYIPANTHKMFHFVLHLITKSNPEKFKGNGNWTSKKNWEKISKTPKGRRQMYAAIYLSSKVVDKFCRLKAPASLAAYVKKYKKEFIGEK